MLFDKDENEKKTMNTHLDVYKRQGYILHTVCEIVQQDYAMYFTFI